MLGVVWSLLPLFDVGCLVVGDIIVCCVTFVRREEGRAGGVRAVLPGRKSSPSRPFSLIISCIRATSASVTMFMFIQSCGGGCVGRLWHIKVAQRLHKLHVKQTSAKFTWLT